MSQKRECLIHVGAHKTGTSLFQQILFDNPAMRPGGAGVYPHSGIWPYDRSHNLFGSYFWNDVRPDLQSVSFDDVIGQILGEAAGADRLIISSETLEKCPIRGNSRIDQFIRVLKSHGYRVTILYVIRRPDQLADSMFKQWVRDFDTKFRAVPVNMARAEAEDMHFARVAEAWRALEGVDRVVVIPFLDSDPLRVVATLLDLCGASQDVAGWRGFIVNPSLDGFSLRFKHFVNRFPFDREFNDRLLLAIDRLVSQADAKSRLTIFSPDDRAAYLRLFQEDWAHIEQRFGVDLDSWRAPTTVTSQVFQPLAPDEVPRGLQWLAEADPTIARTVTELVQAG